MAEHRKFTHAICVKIGAKTDAKFECFPAEQWEDGPDGHFRVRLNRRWLNSPEGTGLYYSPESVARLVAGEAFGTVEEYPVPDLPRGSWVRLDGTQTRTRTAPLRAWDGRWYVAVTLHGKGTVWVPTDELGPVNHLEVQRLSLD